MTFTRGAAALLGCLALGACSFGAPPVSNRQAQANAETVAACRHRADEVYNIQNRPEIFRPPPAVNTPSSGQYAPGTLNNRRLSALFARDQMIRDCIRNTGTETDRGQPQTLRNVP